jgi:hypothetical protein
MKPTPTTSDDAFSDFEDQLSDPRATLDTFDTPSYSENFDWTGPQCDKCEAPLKSDVVTVCRRCGWYASLGTYVEIHKDWEIHGDDEAAATAPQPQPSHLQIWLHVLPQWAWIILGTTAAIVVESIAVRLLTDPGSPIRTAWTLTQVVGGYFVFFACHFLNLLIVAGEDPDVGVLDLLLKPMKLWAKAVRELPKRLWLANSALNGLLAAEIAILVIGGLPYDRMWDWGFKQPPKENLMAAVMKQAAKAKSDGAKDLESAVTNFAGDADASADGGKKVPEPKAAETPRQQTDCLILGYHADKDGNVLSIVLGTAHGGKLVYAGALTPKLEGEELAAFTKALAAARTDRPFLDVQSDAVWVRPTYSCRVSYLQQDDSGHLSDAKWVKLLGSTGL